MNTSQAPSYLSVPHVNSQFFLLRYSVVDNEGIMYLVLLPSDCIPLTLTNTTQEGILYTLGSMRNASVLLPGASVESFWEEESIDQKSTGLFNQRKS